MSRVDDPVGVRVEDGPEGLNQRAARQVVDGQYDRDQRYALTGDRGLDDVTFVAEADARTAIDIGDPGLPKPGRPGRRLVGQVGPLEVQQGVAGQIALGSNGETRTASGCDPVDHQPARVEAGIGTGPVSDGDVHAVAGEVDQAVGRVQSQIATGMRGPEVGEPGHEPLRHEGGRGRERENAGRVPAADLIDGSGERVETVAQHGQQNGALGGQPDPARLAVEETQPQGLLEKPDLMTDGGRRDTQLVGGSAEAQAAPGRLEGPERREGGEAISASSWLNVAHRPREENAFVIPQPG